MKTRELFHDGWLDTGDRGYMAGGDLFITGRIKDIIIRAGQHIAPHEIEEAVGSIPGLRKTGVAAFGIAEQKSGTERVVVLAETEERDPSVRAKLKLRAQEVATHIVGGPPDEVVLVRPGTVPKTASGKIRRAAARDLYLGRQFSGAKPRGVVADRTPGSLWDRHSSLPLRPRDPRTPLCCVVVGDYRRELFTRLDCRHDAAIIIVALGRGSHARTLRTQASGSAIIGSGG